VLRHATEPRIKIGLSVNPAQRARSLRDPINYARSLQMPVEAQDLHGAEKTLHFIARAFAINNLPNADGSTEWFRDDALPVVIDALPALGLTVFEPMKIPVATSVQSPERAERERQQQAEDDAQNARALALLTILVEKMRATGRIARRRSVESAFTTEIVYLATSGEVDSELSEIIHNCITYNGELRLERRGYGSIIACAACGITDGWAVLHVCGFIDPIRKVAVFNAKTHVTTIEPRDFDDHPIVVAARAIMEAIDELPPDATLLSHSEGWA